jgi:hypothetical protein
MAGYSGTPLAQKLGIKPDHGVVTIGAPAGYRKLLAPLPKGISFTTEVAAAAAFIHLFVTKRQTLKKRTEATSQTDCRYRRPLGFVAEKIFGRHDRYHGRRYPEGRTAPWFRRCQSLRGR